ncbi:MAG: methylmalonyl-CoA mutase family protein, partial [Limnochordales bacterium]
GVNAYTIEEETPIPILKIGPEIEAKQRERLARVRRERNAARVKETLAEVRRAAQDGDNLVPPILEAVKAYATLGEIIDELRGVFGEYEEVLIL